MVLAHTLDARHTTKNQNSRRVNKFYSDIKESVKRKETAGAIFADCPNVFDKRDLNIFIQKMHALSFSFDSLN